MRTSGPCVTIDLSSLRSNFDFITQFCGTSRTVVAMIKSDAYGHGIVSVAKALSHADYFGVARSSEAAEIRDAGLDNRIIIFGGFFDEFDLVKCLELGVEFVIHQIWQVKYIVSSGIVPKDARIWIKLDSGMNRLGFKPKDVEFVYEHLSAAGYCNIVFISHLSESDSLRFKKTLKQESLFKDMLNLIGYSGQTSLLNSGGVLNFNHLPHNIVRCGLAIYGVDPSQKKNATTLKPVMTLNSIVIAINFCSVGSEVGYSGTWKSRHNTNLAVVAIGYGDGYPRHAKSGTPVFIKGKRYKLVGRVSMDMITVDIGNDSISVGDSVELWGNNLPIEEVADFSSTIPYDLMVGLTRRVPRIYID